MTTQIIQTASDRAEAIQFIESMKLPITLNVTKGKNRSTEQNKLQRLWLNEAAEQLQDDTAEYKRGYCKLHFVHFSVPMLRMENEAFREAYDRVIRPHSYEDKITMMMEPLDFPVTRLMSSAQKKRYLDDIWIHFTGLGVRLSDPDARWEAA